MKRKVMMVLALALCLIMMFACGKRNSLKALSRIFETNKAKNFEQMPSKQQQQLTKLITEYFPHQVGATWKYNINRGRLRPVWRSRSFWPMGGEATVCYVRAGLFMGAVLPGQSIYEKFILEYRIKNNAALHGSSAVSRSVEVEIMQDTLGIFRDVKQVFWSIGLTDIFTVEQVEYLDAMNFPGGSFWGGSSADGFATRMIFFGDLPGMSIAPISSDGIAPESIIFEGLDQDCLHFRRVIDPTKGDDELSDDSGDPLRVRFTEDVWFEYGKGLVKLEQRYAGEISMTWELASFSP